MLTVIKRSGHKEDFNLEKIKHSLASASDELKMPLGSGDINSLASDLMRQLPENGEITSKEIYEDLIHLLITRRFSQLAQLYIDHTSNHWVNN